MSRTVVIGDVHGCAHELGDLFDRVAVSEGDRVVFVGDLVARGPDTRRVLALAREVGATAVRGNHEQRLLDARAAERAGRRRPRLSDGHYALLRGLGEEEWRQLSEMPLYIDLPAHGAAVVHAGVVPGKALCEQSPRDLIHIRSLTPEGQPSARATQRSWAESYDDSKHLVFGHNSWLRLQLAPCATGIDTGCVYGGSLTALVLPGQSPIPPDRESRRALLVSVEARRAYFRGHRTPR